MERAVWLDHLEGLGIIEYLESLERLENQQLRPWRLSALALVFFQLILQLFYTFFQLFYLVGLRLNCFVLGLSAAQSGSRHAFFYSAFFNEGLFQLGQVGGHHPVHLSAEGEGQVGQFLVRSFGEHTAEVLQFVVGAAISQHVCKAGMAVIPFAQVAGSEVVLVIFLQLLNACPRHIDEPDFHFRGADAIGAALRNVCFPERAACFIWSTVRSFAFRKRVVKANVSWYSTSVFL